MLTLAKAQNETTISSEGMMAVPTVRAPGVHVSETLDQGGLSPLDFQVENEESEPTEGLQVRSMPAMVLPPCQELSPEELDPVKAFVTRAVCYPENTRPPQGYRAIQDCLRKRDDPPMVLKVLIALRTTGSTLNNLTRNPKRHAQLVHLIFRLDPFEPSPSNGSRVPSSNDLSVYENFSLSNAYLHLIVALVSANSVFLTPAMNAVWKLLATEGGPDRTARLHAALATLLRLVPKGNTDLYPVLASHFPFRTKPKAELEWYTRQCLFVAKYVPTVYGRLLELLIDKCLEIDVEIKIDDGGDVSIENDSDLFELELTESSDENTHEDKGEDVERVDEMADKLDALMQILFEHVHESSKTGTLRPRLFFTKISPVFESSVLTTHRSKFVQFIIFYVCGLDHLSAAESCDSLPRPVDDTLTANQSEGLYREFCSKLIGIVFDSYRATVTRQSAACYLASFLSRASYVCTETVCETLCALLRWGEAYLHSLTRENALQLTDSRDQCETHSLFYTICQAAFYTMCFRGSEAVRYYRSVVETGSNTDITEDDASKRVDPICVDISPQRWEKVCCHNLQPLRYCLESVRGEFLHVSQVFKLLSPNLLERLVVEDRNMTSTSRTKARATLITTTATLDMRRRAQGVGGLGGGKNPLDSFFPFDPYLLRQSHGFVHQFYREWDGSIEDADGVEVENDIVPIEEDGSSDDESIEGDSSDRSSTESNDGTPHSIESTMGFQKMSLSPSRSLVRSNEIALKTPNAAPREREARTEVLKRPRQPSIEHGSW